MNDNRTLMTIQERMECMKNSMAYSPADAARRVKSMAKVVISKLLTEDEKNTDVFADDISEYGEYCASVKAQAEENLSRTDKSSYESAYGNSVADIIVSLAFTLTTITNRFGSETSKPQIYFDLKMTLGDYLDALIDLSISADGTADTARTERYRNLKKELSEYCDLSVPLCKAVKDILEQYCEPRAVLRRAAHIINCDFQAKYRIQEQEMREEYFNDYFYDNDYDYDDNYEETTDNEDFTDNDDKEETEEIGSPCVFSEAEPSAENDMDEIVPVAFVMEEDPSSRKEREEIMEQEYIIDMDPYKYYFELAKEPLKNQKSSFGREVYNTGVSAEDLLLLSGNYSPEAAKQQADKSDLYPEFRALIDDMVTEESISGAFREIDTAISKLYRLLVEPFAELGKYHFERHLAKLC